MHIDRTLCWMRRNITKLKVISMIFTNLKTSKQLHISYVTSLFFNCQTILTWGNPPNFVFSFSQSEKNINSLTGTCSLVEQNLSIGSLYCLSETCSLKLILFFLVGLQYFLQLYHLPRPEMKHFLSNSNENPINSEKGWTKTCDLYQLFSICLSEPRWFNLNPLFLVGVLRTAFNWVTWHVLKSINISTIH